MSDPDYMPATSSSSPPGDSDPLTQSWEPSDDEGIELDQFEVWIETDRARQQVSAVMHAIYNALALDRNFRVGGDAVGEIADWIFEHVVSVLNNA